MLVGDYMHLIMFDLDGTLLKSNALDIHCFSGAFSCVMGIENIGSDWTDFKYVTDEGIVAEIVARQLNRPATKNEIRNIRIKIIELLQSQTHTNRESFEPILQVRLNFFVCSKKLGAAELPSPPVVGKNRRFLSYQQLGSMWKIYRLLLLMIRIDARRS